MAAVILSLLLFPSPFLFAGPPDQSQPGKAVYEFRGKITFPDLGSWRGSSPVVFLQGALTSFVKYTRADSSGKFKFSKLKPGVYVLSIAVRGRGEMAKTVSVGPDTASAAGVVEETFVFVGQIMPGSQHRVTASQLTIPKAARRQYEHALNDLKKPDVEAAREKLKKAVELAPRFSAAWNQLGVVAYHSQNYVEAERCFREAMISDPQSYSPVVNLGGALISQVKPEEALPFNQRAVQMAPGDPLAQSQLGINYYLLNQLDLAEKHLLQTKALDPRHFSHPQLVLSAIYRLQNQPAKALKELNEFLVLYPDSPIVPEVRLLIEKMTAASATKP